MSDPPRSIHGPFKPCHLRAVRPLARPRTHILHADDLVLALIQHGIAEQSTPGIGSAQILVAVPGWVEITRVFTFRQQVDELDAVLGAALLKPCREPQPEPRVRQFVGGGKTPREIQQFLALLPERYL